MREVRYREVAHFFFIRIHRLSAKFANFASVKHFFKVYPI